MPIDAGLAGSLAAQGIFKPAVYKRPLVGLISTGSELADGDAPLAQGQIRNSNRYAFSAALGKAGCNTLFLGVAQDDAAEICRLLESAFPACDALLITGGVSVGDYDLTPAAMEMAGVDILVREVGLKPGMACCHGIKHGKLVCGLSGNPASALTNYYAVVQPAIKKLAGRRDAMPTNILVELATAFPKKSRCDRLLRGKLTFSGGKVQIQTQEMQGNVVLSSAIGCDAMACIPAGSGPLEAGTELAAFLL